MDLSASHILREIKFAESKVQKLVSRKIKVVAAETFLNFCTVKHAALQPKSLTG